MNKSERFSLPESLIPRSSSFLDNHHVYQQFLYLAKKDASIQRKDDIIKKNYSYDLQLATYSNFTSIESLQLFSIVGENELNQKIVFFFACRVPEDSGLLEKSYLQFIFKMEPILNNGYILIFFNTGVSNFEQKHFAFLRNCYQRLPIKYLTSLVQLIIISPSLLVKSLVLFSNSFETKIIEDKTIYIDNIRELLNCDFFKPEFKKNIPEFIIAKDDSGTKRTGIIGSSLMEMSLSDSGIPELLVFMIYYFEVLTEHLNTQGIFRVNASGLELETSEKEINKLNYESIFQIKDPNVVAGLIKKLFTNMPEPLLRYENYDGLMKVGFMTVIEEKKTEIKKIIKSLPKLNYRTLGYMIDFIKKIEAKKEKNSMTAYNLSVVFMPCFIRPLKYSDDDLKNSMKLIEVLRMIIDGFEEIFETPSGAGILEEQEEMDEGLFKSQFISKNDIQKSVRSESLNTQNFQNLLFLSEIRPKKTMSPPMKKAGIWNKFKDLFN